MNVIALFPVIIIAPPTLFLCKAVNGRPCCSLLVHLLLLIIVHATESHLSEEKGRLSAAMPGQQPIRMYTVVQLEANELVSHTLILFLKQSFHCRHFRNLACRADGGGHLLSHRGEAVAIRDTNTLVRFHVTPHWT